ncbi:hypothetical protein Tcan_14776 [Toxocara canis]|uniref:Uncharacterized protein n=1 Tax=Toxocara canis TaxID=6265 RepID=A0A0B2UUI9_TOXCA|nr:hypothetical protein Tcan_14776 [Toxocara canis]
MDNSFGIVEGAPPSDRIHGSVVLAEKRLASIIRYLKQELNDNLELLETTRAENQQLKKKIAQYEKKIDEQNIQCQQYEHHNADLREKKRSYLERLKSFSVIVSQQNFDAGNWGIILDEMSFVSRELWDLLRRSITAEQIAAKAEAVEEEKFASESERLLKTRTDLREQLYGAMDTYESQRSQIRITEENLSRLGKILDVYDAEFWQLSDVKSDLQMQIYKLEEMVRKSGCRIQPVSECFNDKDRNGYDGPMDRGLQRKRNEFHDRSTSATVGASPETRWKVESSFVKQLHGNRAVRMPTADRQIPTVALNSSKGLASIAQGLRVNFPVAFHTGSSATPSTFSEISDSGSAPFVIVRTDQSERADMRLSSDASNRRDQPNAKVVRVQRGTDVRSFMSPKSPIGRSTSKTSSSRKLSNVKPIGSLNKDERHDTQPVISARENKHEQEQIGDVGGTKETSTKNCDLDSSYDGYKSMVEATPRQLNLHSLRLPSSDRNDELEGAPVDTVNSSSAVWASGTTATGTYSPLVERILGGRIAEMTKEDTQATTETEESTSEESAESENTQESQSNEEEMNEKQTLSDNYFPTLMESTSSSMKSTMGSSQEPHSMGSVESKEMNKTFVIAPADSFSSSQYTTNTNELDTYDSNDGIPAATPRSPSQSSFFEQPSYLEESPEQSSPALTHMPYSDLLTDDEMETTGEYCPLAEAIVESAIRSNSSSSSPLSRFTLPTSVTTISSLSNRNITEKAFDEIISSADLANLMSPPASSTSNESPSRLEQTQGRRASICKADVDCAERDSTEDPQLFGCSDDESFTTASSTSYSRPNGRSGSSLPDDVKLSLAESGVESYGNHLEDDIAFNMESSTSYASHSTNSNVGSTNKSVVSSEDNLLQNPTHEIVHSSHPSSYINSGVIKFCYCCLLFYL